jgi:hypothetical protein
VQSLWWAVHALRPAFIVHGDAISLKEVVMIVVVVVVVVVVFTRHGLLVLRRATEEEVAR